MGAVLAAPGPLSARSWPAPAPLAARSPPARNVTANVTSDATRPDERAMWQRVSGPRVQSRHLVTHDGPHARGGARATRQVGGGLDAVLSLLSLLSQRGAL